jgi:REP element-mobilizing transposase RayT
VTRLKRLTAREIFRQCPQVKQQLWGGEFWTDGYFASTVGRHGSENTIANYVKAQRNTYDKLHENQQLTLF